MRAIPGFPGYFATTDGHIVSTRRIVITPSGIRALPFLTERAHPRTGHLRVDLRDETGHKRTMGVHQLVCLAYHGEGEGEVLHSGGIPTVNTPDNLRWGTTQENAQERESHKRERVAAARPVRRWLNGGWRKDEVSGIEYWYVPSKRLVA